ncbi:MAG TPA: aminotransferase class I/II-fold pyridoxal phosphate-dependent enzyme [Candidatus Latescibacteria bacterium]|nr:aminotransferase class I/II-fold pyridoxal phosphate-dependent enzyme [Candidatus Latescibacterota bacterium]HJP32788.1 aminotransferase class I/II-fold pyridoxal phosphate-dependent enzyme [Candidatus Latescibacterota bacterium]
MNPRLPLTDIVSSLPKTVPFVGPESLARSNGRPLRVRIGANESAFGVSPAAAEAMQSAVKDLWMYNDPEAHDLITALAAHHHVPTAELHVGAGIDEILGDLVRVLVSPGKAVVTSLGAYPTFNYHVNGYGGRLVEVPYVQDRADLVGLAQAAQEHGASIVYLANPDNPMGTWRVATDVVDLLACLPADCVLILDEAYADFSPAEAIPPLDTIDPRLVRTRTFSKAHGMAGARVGWAIAHAEVVAALNRVRNQFGVNRVAQAGALASLGDPEFIAGVVRQVEAGRREYGELAAELGLGHIESATNFVNIDLGSGERARATLTGLLQRDVFVRMPGKPPGDRCIRVTVGTPEQRDLFAEALRDTVGAGGR